MDDETQRLEQFLDLFLHPSWGELMKDLTEAETFMRNIDTLDTVEQLHYRKGQLERMRYFLGFEDMVRRLLENHEPEAYVDEGI